MGDEPNVKPARTATEKLARASSMALKACGVCIVVLLLLLIPLFPALSVGRWAAFYGALWLVVVLIGLLAGVVRIGMSVFAETQMHLNEMLATLFVAGTITVGLIPALDFGSAYQPGRDAVRALLGLFVFLVIGVGSTWGWSACRRLGIGETWQRMKFLLYGWLLAVGACGLAVFGSLGLLLLTWLIFGSPSDQPPTEFLAVLAVSALGPPLMFPAMRTERACRLKARADATPPPENLPPSA